MASAKIVNVGLAGYASLIINGGQAVFKYGQVGTSVSAVTATDTALNTPTNDARVAGTQTRVTTNVTNDTVQNVYTITMGTGATITECGDFDGAGTGTPATGGNMSDHAEFTGVALNTGDSIQITGQTVLTSTT